MPLRDSQLCLAIRGALEHTQAHTTVRFRVDPDMPGLLDRLHDEKDINVSAWVRRQLRAALEREFPGSAEATEPLESETTPGTEAPQPDTAPIAGWKPRRLPSGKWGVGLEAERVAGLPDIDQLRGATIGVTDSKGSTWNTTILDVVGRTETSILVRTSSRQSR